MLVAREATSDPATRGAPDLVEEGILLNDDAFGLQRMPALCRPRAHAAVQRAGRIPAVARRRVAGVIHQQARLAGHQR
eukprot:6984897-Prymnesium_polylepis.2